MIKAASATIVIEDQCTSQVCTTDRTRIRNYLHSKPSMKCLPWGFDSVSTNVKFDIRDRPAYKIRSRRLRVYVCGYHCAVHDYANKLIYSRCMRYCSKINN